MASAPTALRRLPPPEDKVRWLDMDRAPSTLETPATVVHGRAARAACVVGAEPSREDAGAAWRGLEPIPTPRHHRTIHAGRECPRMRSSDPWAAANGSPASRRRFCWAIRPGCTTR